MYYILSIALVLFFVGFQRLSLTVVIFFIISRFAFRKSPPQPQLPPPPPSSPTIFTDEFSGNLFNNFIELLENEKDFDVIIVVGEYQKKEFKAHSIVLKYRSLYFRKELTNKDFSSIPRIILNPRISIQHFEIIRKYIYVGVLSFEDLDDLSTFDIMLAACLLQLEDLAKHIETYLIENKSHWLNRNFVTRVYRTIFQNEFNKLQKLQKWCNDIVAKYPSVIFGSEYFALIPENALASILERDDLKMEEIEVWNSMIKWGISNNQGLPNELKNWTHENFQTLKDTLQHCLPHIRYFHISGDDVVKNIRPYKRILDKDLWKDLSNRLMSPNCPISSIIKPPRNFSKKKNRLIRKKTIDK
ncbi:BTB/POZ protein [Gigaspora rosea]|uniref:BTB/POZ protein n=1 Tax=Gigaspora rosea TaxID=44941 RepID=A0A397TX63_9GLOM|nr:BTB/POZ protein [Gigaspora rosea]